MLLKIYMQIMILIYIKKITKNILDSPQRIIHCYNNVKFVHKDLIKLFIQIINYLLILMIIILLLIVFKENNIIIKFTK